ncbi:unnamed protein product [Nippostrongylus brasiliensis]|uniref:G protein-coupled receptor n=1 Tax=Nippostrongylus brasiliensis TaxID=27835 RepID=A0A0N4YHE7_NIPBR|nr:unnamed protein product [Nippostrongylus brasiliensis]
MTLDELDYLIPHGRTMFTLLLTLNFWATAGCYSVLALFMFLAVRHPIIYRVKITSKRTSEVNQHLMSIVRMSLNIFAFAISCVVMAAFVSIPIALKGQIDDLNSELLAANWMIFSRSNEHGIEFLRKCAEMNVMPISVISGSGRYFRFRSPTVDTGIAAGTAQPPRRKINHLRFDQRVL